MNDELTVRRAEAADVERAAELAGRLVRLHHATDARRFFLPERVEEGYAAWFRRELRRPEAVILVAIEARRCVGYAYGSVEARDWNLLLDRHGTVHDLYVSESARARGIGRALAKALLVELRALGAPRVVLSTMVGNQRAQHLFASCGFRPTMLEMTHDFDEPPAGAPIA